MLRESFTYRPGARYYDPRISQFYGVDPLAHKYPGMSPFTYTADNPVMLVDPDGRAPQTDFINISTGERMHIEDGKDQVIAITPFGLSYMVRLYYSNRGAYHNALSDLEKTNLNLHMTTKEFNTISGTIAHEASVNGPWIESAAIYSVLRNRAHEKKTNVLQQIKSKKGGVAGYKKYKQDGVKGFSVSRLNKVYKGIAMAIVTRHDYSNGAYWWDGVDFNGRNPKNNGGYTDRYLQGYRFTDPSHDYWGLGDHPVNGHTIWGSYKYKYESTAFYGRTTFSRKTEEYRRVETQGPALYRPYP